MQIAEARRTADRADGVDASRVNGDHLFARKPGVGADARQIFAEFAAIDHRHVVNAAGKRLLGRASPGGGELGCQPIRIPQRRAENEQEIGDAEHRLLDARPGLDLVGQSPDASLNGKFERARRLEQQRAGAEKGDLRRVGADGRHITTLASAPAVERRRFEHPRRHLDGIRWLPEASHEARTLSPWPKASPCRRERFCW